MTLERITQILKNIGLTELEIRCYLELIRKSPQRASQLSLTFNSPKATVLNALNILSNKYGLINKTKKKNSFEFLVEDVDRIIGYFERQVDNLEENKKQIQSLLPELRSLQQFDVNKPKIYYFEGKDGMKQAFEQVLDEADEIIGYGSNEDDIKYLPNLYPNYYERRIKRKIPVKAIIPATLFNKRETIKNEQKHLRQTHLIPAEFNYPIQVNIYKNKAIFYSFEENFALLVESKPIAKCLKKIFEMAFDKAVESDKQIRNTAL